MDVPATIIALLSLVASGAVSVVMKMLWDTVQGIRRENDKLSTRVNALEVDIVKLAQINRSLEKIEHGIDDLKERIEASEKEAIRVRSTYIPRIENLENHYKDIMDGLKELSKLKEILRP